MKRSLYREYRPQTFDELVGQHHVARTLRNAVETGAVAHAYVFAGPRGTGKTSTARILAKSLDCVGPDGTLDHPTPTPCGVCTHCLSIAGASSLDVIEMDAASHRGIEDVRDLRETIAFAPVQGRFKVYIIDEVHMLTREAFNALLKTLEEPPSNVVFVLATTEPHKIPETIISRCQRFDFRRPQVADIAGLLAHIVERENAKTDEERGGPRVDIQQAALLEIARHSQGGFRDAIGTLEKLVTYAEGAIAPADVLEALGVTGADLLFEVTDLVAERQTAAALQFVQRLADEGTDYSQFIRDLLRHLRRVFLLQHLEAGAADEATLRALGQTVELDDQLMRRLLPQARRLPPAEVVRFIEALGTAQSEIRDGLDPRLQLELALVKVTRPDLDHGAAALEERLRRLEAAMGGAAAPAAATPPAAPQAAAPQATTSPAAPQVAATPSAAARKTASARKTAAEAAMPPATPAAPPEPAPDATAVQDAAATPGASAPSPPEAPAAQLTLERVKRAWDLVLQHLQGGSPSLYAMLREARPSALQDGRLTVSIPSNVALARARMPGNPELLTAAVEATLGAALAVTFVAGESPATTATAAPAAPTADVDFTDLIKQANQIFDAEPLPDDS
jgi:DNA polymerase III subunit gamma/tau